MLCMNTDVMRQNKKMERWAEMINSTAEKAGKKQLKMEPAVPPNAEQTNARSRSPGIDEQRFHPGKQDRQ